MENVIKIITHHSEYKDSYEGDYLSFYQIHIFSTFQIISKYYDPKCFEISEIDKMAEELLKTIQKGSARKNLITLFKEKGKFVISEHAKFVDTGELLIYLEKFKRFDYSENSEDFFDVIGDIKPDVFIKRSLISVGAEDLYSIIEPHVKKICLEQDRLNTMYNRDRLLNKTDPKYMLEFYRISKGYKPVKIAEFLCHSIGTSDLPEFIKMERMDRVFSIYTEIATNKTIDGNIDEAVENFKKLEWYKNNPSVIDINTLQRFELENDDPNFLNMDDYNLGL